MQAFDSFRHGNFCCHGLKICTEYITVRALSILILIQMDCDSKMCSNLAKFTIARVTTIEVDCHERNHATPVITCSCPEIVSSCWFLQGRYSHATCRLMTTLPLSKYVIPVSFFSTYHVLAKLACLFELITSIAQSPSMAAQAPNGSNKCTLDSDIAEENKKKLQFIEDVTANAGQIQKQVLAEILSRNANVEYLRRHGLSGRTDHDSFKKFIPVITYEDIQSDIYRIANGNSSPILSSTPMSELLTSSGSSSGELKLIPANEEDLERSILVHSLAMPIMSQFVPDIEKGKGMYLLFTRSESKTPGGLLTCTTSTRYYKSSYFTDRPYYLNLTSPNETIHCLDAFQSMYSQLLCGLCQHKQVLWVGTFYANGLVVAMRFLEKHWPQLCKDIRTGTLNPKISDTSVREAVRKILKPDPELADFLEAEFSRSSWQGIIKRLWSKTEYVDAVVTGTMSQYIPKLDYYSNGLPIASLRYYSTECCFGVNTNPLSKPNEIAYTLLPNVCYYEFIPVHRDNDLTNSPPVTKLEKGQTELVDLVDVKLGQDYELVITTYPGLYRYRVGDILRVAGFKNKTPQFNFISRNNAVLSIDIETTDEVELQKAMKNAVKHLVPFDATVTDYTSYADTTTIPGHYVLYWELSLNKSTPIPHSVFEDCCITFEESLNSWYRRCRSTDKAIEPLEIKIVEPGTFDKLMDRAINLGASMSQYKTPMCVKSAAIVELLDSRVMSSYFSTKCPTWMPGHKQWNNQN